MGGAEGSREVQAGGARSMGSLYICVKTPARSYLHEGTLTCMQAWVVDPVSLSCLKVTHPTAARAGVSGSSAATTAISSTRLFRLGVICGRSDAPNRGYWHLCRAVREAPGDPRAGFLGPSEAFVLSPSLLIPGRVSFPRCAARSASTIWLSLTPWTVLLVPDPTYLAARPIPEAKTSPALRPFD